MDSCASEPAERVSDMHFIQPCHSRPHPRAATHRPTYKQESRCELTRPIGHKCTLNTYGIAGTPKRPSRIDARTTAAAAAPSMMLSWCSTSDRQAMSASSTTRARARARKERKSEANRVCTAARRHDAGASGARERRARRCCIRGSIHTISVDAPESGPLVSLHSVQRCHSTFPQMLLLLSPSHQ